MNLTKSISPLQKRSEITPVLSMKKPQAKRLNSILQSSLNQTLKIKIKTPLEKSLTKKPIEHYKNIRSQSKENTLMKTQVLDRNKENSQFLTALKTYLITPTTELNIIAIEIHKYSARKVQDLKKLYKPTENYDALVTSFLIVFGEIDESINKELVSLRRKIGEIFTSYLSNSGKLYRLIRSLPEILKKLEISQKALIEAKKSLEIVDKQSLSSIYQDLYDLLKLIIDFWDRGLKKSHVEDRTVLGVRKINCQIQEEDKDFFDCSGIFNTYDGKTQSNNNTSTEISFNDLVRKPMTCLNKNKNFIDFSNNPNINKSPLLRAPVRGSTGKSIGSFREKRSSSQSALARTTLKRKVKEDSYV
ncbi:hypothetical protein SteCoe_30826 [Stentor coeruleus]|uniref:Uncharacterized protein n=1 Tax=Stentor coeruleus TaxID=5963 RepID=A0A1R2B2T8_9CILI|nr:hypothetical protein SteCoe_30826 [Stentor coeruleus]